MSDFLTRMGQRIRERRIALKMSQTDLANLVGYSSRSSINKVEKGLVDIPQSKIKAMADVLITTPAYLMGWEEKEADSDFLAEMEERGIDIRHVSLKRFPMLGEIACGEPIFANEDHESYIDASADIKADFCLTARGDSMIGARIHDGDVVFIRKQPIVDNGEIAAVVIDNEATLKRWYFYPDEKKLVLAAENSAFAPFVYIGAELDEIVCLGKAVCFMSNL